MKRNTPMVLRCAATACVLLVTASPASAQGKSPLIGRWEIDLGGFLASTDTLVRVDPTVLRGTEVRLEDDLSLSDSESLFWGNVGLRLGRRHRLGAGLFDLERAGQSRLEAEIRIADRVFELGADVESRFDTRFLLLDYQYLFVERERTAVSVLFGLSSIGLRFAVALRGDEIEDREGVDIDSELPIPVLGFALRQRIAPKLVFVSRISGLVFKIDKYGGDVINVFVGLEYRTWQHFGFGMKYDYLRYNVDETRQSGDRKYRFRVEGFHLYGRIAF